MLKRSLLFLGLSSLLGANSFHYDVHMEFKRGQTPDTCNNTFVVNGEKVKCPCGRNPTHLLFAFGAPAAYCYKHIPVNPDTLEITFEDILSTSAESENGTNEKQK